MNWLEQSPTLSEFLGHIRLEFKGSYFLDVWFSSKSILTINLNHSNRIRNEQVMAKIRRLVKTEKQNATCTGTGAQIFPIMWVFLHFFHIFSPKSTQYSIYSSKPLHIHLEVSIILNSSFNTYLSSKFFHESLPKQLSYGS